MKTQTPSRCLNCQSVDMDYKNMHCRTCKTKFTKMSECPQCISGKIFTQIGCYSDWDYCKDCQGTGVDRATA
jgi:hypothetical protein